VNSGGNNIIIQNSAGVAQGAAAGNANTSRWKYSFASDPSTQVQIGHTMLFSGHSSLFNNGTFSVVDVNETTANNVVIYNESGVAQIGAAGTTTHTRKLIKFFSDQSLIYSTASYIEMEECPDSNYNIKISTLPYKVLQVNRGGGANFNIVIDLPAGGSQAGAAGFISIEGRSIFTAADGSKPQVSSALLGKSPNRILKAEFSGSAISTTPVPAQTYLGLYILQMQAGSPENLSVILN